MEAHIEPQVPIKVLVASNGQRMWTSFRAAVPCRQYPDRRVREASTPRAASRRQWSGRSRFHQLSPSQQSKEFRFKNGKPFR
jgi:hypothetical protein